MKVEGSKLDAPQTMYVAFDAERHESGRISVLEGTVRIAADKRCVLCGNTPEWVYYIRVDVPHRPDDHFGFCEECLKTLRKPIAVDPASDLADIMLPPGVKLGKKRG